MFRIVSFCLFLSCFLRIGAQNIKVESFIRVENDLTARVNVVRDANDDECALIKMETTVVDYNMDESLKRDDSRPGEIWFYVPQGTKRIVIRHQKLGKLVYALPETLKAKTTYKIELSSNNVEIIMHEDAGGQYVVMSVQPSDASVYIDDILEVTNGGNFSRMLRYGDHIYRVEHPLYETKSGAFTVKNKKEQIEIKLVPAYGYLSFTSTPANAEITVNGKILGRTPFKSEALREGTYRVKTSLSSYSEDEREVTVVRGQTSDIAIPLSATFGYIEVNTVPEQGADVYVNGMKVGKTPYRSDKLSEGICRVKVVQSMYSPQEKEVQIAKGQTQQVAFDMSATFAEVIIRAESPQAEIYVNDQKKGIGEWKGRLTEGIYLLKSHMDSHRDGVKSVEIKSGINQEVTIPAPTARYGTLNVSSNPIGGVVKIDGKTVGRTPEVISNVLIGERKIEIQKEGCATFEQIVTIEEGKVKELKVSLAQWKEICIEAFEPVDIEIDGTSYSKTPFQGILSYGEHILKAKNNSGTFDIQETFIVTESSPSNLLIRNKPITCKIMTDREVTINGISYACYCSNSKVKEVSAYDHYANQQVQLPVLENCSFYDTTICDDIQGCFVLGSNVWINGKWEKRDIFSFPEDRWVIPYKNHGYLYMLRRYQKYFDIVRKDIVTDQEQILFSYATKFIPYVKFEIVDETIIQCKGILTSKDGEKRKGNLNFSFRVDSIPFPPLVCGSYLMGKEDYIGEVFLTNSTPTFSASAIDWNSFPEKYYSKAKEQVYIISNAAYVPVIRSTSITLSIGALYKYDFQSKTWNKCPHKFIPNKVGKVYTSNPAPNSSFHPSFSIGVNGKYLVIDSQYRFNTETNSWE